MKLYAYCVAETLPSHCGALSGLGGKSVEFIAVDGLIVAVSEFRDDVVGVTRENVLWHEAVVRKVLAETTPLPFRFGTLINEPALRSFISFRRKALLDRLALVHDAVEMSIKIIWQQTSDAAPTVSDSEGLGAGAAFLLAKQQALLGGDKLTTEARDIADWLSAGLQHLVRKECVNVQPTQKLVVAASYLIDRSSQSGFRTVTNRLESQRPELHFLTSGPWPPYTFANIDLEFETQFGVS
jgi:hypothetical protein